MKEPVRAEHMSYRVLVMQSANYVLYCNRCEPALTGLCAASTLQLHTHSLTCSQIHNMHAYKQMLPPPSFSSSSNPVSLTHICFPTDYC